MGGKCDRILLSVAGCFDPAGGRRIGRGDRGGSGSGIRRWRLGGEGWGVERMRREGVR
ncbi:MAG: hypothetical protein JW984_03015 [Deltaproteobacteria bacterium]|uniref:Uncharacterized protein n=1 Tax=Candidatus Zymogenus saltonus TaxID=2844893 RepID=A0A9D8PM56_9DELT|nr:hypothetical protein [Candidatus Zymogenus saltonus]